MFLAELDHLVPGFEQDVERWEPGIPLHDRMPLGSHDLVGKRHDGFVLGIDRAFFRPVEAPDGLSRTARIRLDLVHGVGSSLTGLLRADVRTLFGD
jgi:hypothetical protein